MNPRPVEQNRRDSSTSFLCYEIYNSKRFAIYSAASGLLSSLLLFGSFIEAEDPTDLAVKCACSLVFFGTLMVAGLQAEDRDAKAARAANIPVVLVNNILQLPPTFEDRLSKIGFNNSEIDKDFLCPISLCVMDDPITTSSGIAYNRASLVDAFSHLGNPKTIKCAINRNHSIKIEELSNLTSVFLKNKIEEFVNKQEKIAQDIVEIKDVLNAVITTIETEEASSCSSSVAVSESDRMRVADLRMRLFSRSIQSHESSNGQAVRESTRVTHTVGIIAPSAAAATASS